MKHMLGFLLLGLLACGLAGPVRAQEPPPPVVQETVVRGYDQVTQPVREQVQAVLTPLQNRPLTEALQRDTRDALLDLGWFFEVTMTTEPVEGGVRLIVTVVENPIVSAIDFAGNTVFSDAELQEIIATKPGSVLNRNQVTRDADAIKARYAKDGYNLVEITDINLQPEADGRGKLVFTIFEPRIGEVRIEGNSRTRDYVIQRELLIRPGAIYNERDIRASLANLERLNIFQEVTAVPEPGTEPGTLIIAIRVKERRTGSAAFGVGHSNINGLIGFIDIADTNFFGTGQRVSARVQVGADDSYQLSYTNPWIGRHRTSMTVNVYDRSILRQAVQADDTILYNEDRTGVNLTLSRPLDAVRRQTRIYTTFRADRVRASQEGNDPVPVGLREESDVRSITLGTIHDSRYPFLSPYRGTYYAFATEYAGFGGADFTKFTAEARRYFIVKHGTEKEGQTTPPQHWVFATRLQAGAITGAPPFLDQFLIGGADTLRGYKEDRFPGKNMLVLNSELRVPFSDALQGVAFVDAGNAWGGAFAEEFGDKTLKFRLGYGLGIRVQTPIGPLRLDYGISQEGGNEFHFGIGSTF